MDDLFKNLWNKTPCKKSGVCSTNPILNALNAVLINEIRQIGFYTVRLKELGLVNYEIIKKAVCALSITISDTNFDKDALYALYKDLKTTKKEIRDFYIKKSHEMNISYEFITPIFAEDKEEFNTNDLIKNGENLVRNFFNSAVNEKIRLYNLIILMCKTAAIKIYRLEDYREAGFEYYYETLRLLSLTNYMGIREEKLIRRIKEFSQILYKLQEEFDFELEKAYGKREAIKTNTNIYKGKAVLIDGGNLRELFCFLEKIKGKEINVYLTPRMFSVFSYTKFLEFKNLKGIFGKGDMEQDFSDFRGPIFITRNSTGTLDNVFRGTIFTTKIIHSDKITGLNYGDFDPLIEEIEKQEGFLEDKTGEEIRFEYNLNKTAEILDKNRDKKILCIVGSFEDDIREKFKDFIHINFICPNETLGVHYVINRCDPQKTSFHFSSCTQEIIGTIISLFDKELNSISMSSCLYSDISPHVMESLTGDFGVKIL